jgi:hypothetical protein
MIKSVTQHSYFEKKPNMVMGRFPNNPSIGWVHPTSTHVRPLAWGNKNLGTPKCMWLTSLVAKKFHAYLYFGSLFACANGRDIN